MFGGQLFLAGIAGEIRSGFPIVKPKIAAVFNPP
jgi:hypothetical protein